MNKIKKRMIAFLCILMMLGIAMCLTEHEKEGEKMRFYGEAQYFPIAALSEEETFIFEDSFGGARSYGGERKHEGIDIMLDGNCRGSHPVVSVSYGTVTKLGWLELGGYRVGITAEDGTYFYYAHLYRYDAQLQEGMEVVPGQILGYTGDSGYGPEGTVGQFEEHLHFGIYVTGKDGKEEAVNPYPFLSELTGRIIRFYEK